MTVRERWRELGRSMDEAVEGLTAFDAEGLESLERRIRTVTAEYRAHGLTFGRQAGSRETLAELLQKHTLLQALLKATAANLKVMDGRRTNELDRRKETHGYLDLTAEPVAQRADRRPGGAERNGQ